MNRMENLPRVFRQKKKKMMRLSFITQFKTEFLLLFTGFIKVLRKNAWIMGLTVWDTIYCMFLVSLKTVLHTASSTENFLLLLLLSLWQRKSNQIIIITAIEPKSGWVACSAKDF